MTMTTPNERSRALHETRRYLLELLYGGAAPAKGPLREEARGLLRHFLPEWDTHLLHLLATIWFGPLASDAEANG